MSDPKNDNRPHTEADPDGRDHSPGLAGAKTREDVDRNERFANSREEGVVDKHNYLDDVGDAVASALDSVIGADEKSGEKADATIDDERRGRDPETSDRDGGAPRT